MAGPISATALAVDTHTERTWTRAHWLASGLHQAGIRADDEVLVVCCDAHHVDRVVAMTAARLLGSEPVALSPVVVDATPREANPRRRVVLACEEGVESWSATAVPAVVIGDAPGVIWWKAVELRGRSQPRSGQTTAPADV